MVILLMGVSGSGKTTIGKLLAAELGWVFEDGDDYHSPANVAKMAAGIPLTDEDRAAWLDALRATIEDLLDRNASGIIACSALRQVYRKQLRADHPDVRLVHLKGDYALILARMEERQGHFMKAALLRSQFEALEEPGEDVAVDVMQEPAAVVRTIRLRLGL